MKNENEEGMKEEKEGKGRKGRRTQPFSLPFTYGCGFKKMVSG